MEMNDDMRKSAQAYRAILYHYGCIDVVRDLSDEAIYDMMFVINWMGGYCYDNYYNEYRGAEKDAEQLKLIREKYVNRTKNLLTKSGYDNQQIEEKLSQGFTEKIIQLHCWPGGLQLIYEDYFGLEEVIDTYISEFETEVGKEVMRQGIPTNAACDNTGLKGHHR